MQRHHIGRTKTSLHIDKRNPFHLVTFRMSVYRLDFHPQGKCDGRYGAADPAQSYDTHSQSVHFYQRFLPVAEIRLGGPLPLPHTFSVKADIRRQLKKKCECMLCDSVRSVRRYVSHHNVLFASCFDIDNIVTGSCHPDRAKRFRSCDHLAVQGRLVCQDDLGVRDAFGYFFGCRSGKEPGIPQFFHGLPAEVAGIQCVSIQYYNFHGVKGVGKNSPAKPKIRDQRYIKALLSLAFCANCPEIYTTHNTEWAKQALPPDR